MGKSRIFTHALADGQREYQGPETVSWEVFDAELAMK